VVAGLDDDEDGTEDVEEVDGLVDVGGRTDEVPEADWEGEGDGPRLSPSPLPRPPSRPPTSPAEKFGSGAK
jgi:hypothetical protein